MLPGGDNTTVFRYPEHLDTTFVLECTQETMPAIQSQEPHPATEAESAYIQQDFYKRTRTSLVTIVPHQRDNLLGME